MPERFRTEAATGGDGHRVAMWRISKSLTIAAGASEIH